MNRVQRNSAYLAEYHKALSWAHFSVFINDIPQIMSNCFGYADDYEIIPDNVVSVQIDARRLLSWCHSNDMSLNTRKCTFLNIKYESRIKKDGMYFRNPELKIGLRIIVNENVTWTELAENRVCKAMRAFI